MVLLEALIIKHVVDVMSLIVKHVLLVTLAHAVFVQMDMKEQIVHQNV